MAAPSRKSTGPILRSLSPSGRFCNSRQPPASCSYPSFFNHATSPTRISLYGSSDSAPSVRFITVAGAGAGQMARRESHNNHHHRHQKRICMCSPTTHPGSFRCSLHKSFGSRSPAAPANRLNASRSAMTNSLVRIRGVEGELVKRALAALIRPSSHQQRRRGEFRPRPSRLSVMSTAKEDWRTLPAAVKGGGFGASG